MRRTVLVLASMTLALLVASGVGLLNAGKPAEAAFPGKNGDIVFTSRYTCGSDAAIFRVSPDGTRFTPLTCDPVMPDFAQYPVWSADGKRIVFQHDADDSDDTGRDLWVMNAAGNNRINITDSPNVDEWQPAWFSSGKKIAYRAAGIEVLTLNARYGSKVTKTTRLTSDGTEPAISPNGKKIAFVSNRDGDSEIYVMRTDAPEGPNNRPVKLTDNATYSDMQPDWSPDGSRIVYVSYRNNAADIFVMRADGSGKKNLTRNPARDQHPVFSPDGRWVAFDSNRSQAYPGSSQIWKMRIDGTRLTQITSDDESLLQPDWQPLP